MIYLATPDFCAEHAANETVVGRFTGRDFVLADTCTADRFAIRAPPVVGFVFFF